MTDFHLLKRNPDLNASRGKRKLKGKGWIVQTAINKNPAGTNVRNGDIIYNYETGYAVWGKSKVIEVVRVSALNTIDEVIEYATSRAKLENDFYWGQLILRKVWPSFKKGKFRFLSVLEVHLETSILNEPFAIPKKYTGQQSWRYLPHEIENEKTALELSSVIPSSLRYQLYIKYNIEGTAHYFDIDHIVPASLGGPGNIEENLVPMAFGINRIKSNSVPYGLFEVAKKRGFLKTKIPTRDSIIKDPQFKDNAKQIISDVHKKLSNIDDIRKFYDEIKRYHYPNLYMQ